MTGIKFQVTPASQHAGLAIQQWAALEQRPVSNLVSLLLDLGLVKARQEGMIPKPILKQLQHKLPRA